MADPVVPAPEVQAVEIPVEEQAAPVELDETKYPSLKVVVYTLDADGNLKAHNVIHQMDGYNEKGEPRVISDVLTEEDVAKGFTKSEKQRILDTLGAEGKFPTSERNFKHIMDTGSHPKEPTPVFSGSGEEKADYDAAMIEYKKEQAAYRQSETRLLNGTLTQGDAARINNPSAPVTDQDKANHQTLGNIAANVRSDADPQRLAAEVEQLAGQEARHRYAKYRGPQDWGNNMDDPNVVARLSDPNTLDEGTKALFAKKHNETAGGTNWGRAQNMAKMSAARDAEAASQAQEESDRAKYDAERVRQTPQHNFARALATLGLESVAKKREVADQLLAQSPYSEGAQERHMTLPPGTYISYVDPTHVRINHKGNGGSVVLELAEGVDKLRLSNPNDMAALENSYYRVEGTKVAAAKHDTQATDAYLKSKGLTRDDVAPMGEAFKQAQAAVKFKGQDETRVAANESNPDISRDNLGELGRQNGGNQKSERGAGLTA